MDAGYAADFGEDPEGLCIQITPAGRAALEEADGR